MQSVGRASQLLMLVASKTTDGSGKNLAAAAGLALPTAHHLLSTLVDEGLLARDANARYLLGPKVAVLAGAFQRQLSVPEYLLGPLQQLADTTGETTYLASWRNDDIQIISMAEGQLAVRVSVPHGAYQDAHARAGGKVLLAFAPEGLRERYLSANPLRAKTPHTIIDPDQFVVELDRIREQRYGTDEEEFLPGVCCIAVPVLLDDVLIAAYAMSVPVQRFPERRDDLTRALLAVSASVERTLAGREGQSIEGGDVASRLESAKR